MMKKIAAMIIMMALCASAAFAAEIDWASMTDDEIRAIIAEAQGELAKRAPIAEDTLPIAEGTVLNNVSNRTVSSENVRRLVMLVLNDSLSVHAVNITPIVKANKKSRFIIP